MKTTRRSFFKAVFGGAALAATAGVVRAKPRPKPKKKDDGYGRNHPWVGKYIAVYRENFRTDAAHVLGVKPETKDSGPRIKYVILTGPDKGAEFNARFDDGERVNVYTDKRRAIAFAEGIG